MLADASLAHPDTQGRGLSGATQKTPGHGPSCGAGQAGAVRSEGESTVRPRRGAEVQAPTQMGLGSGQGPSLLLQDLYATIHSSRKADTSPTPSR